FTLPGGPCGYASAEAHYAALVEDVQRRGGPTRHTRETLPDWSGHWGTDNGTGEVAIVGLNSTAEGMAARLKPEAREVVLHDRRRLIAEAGIGRPLAAARPGWRRSMHGMGALMICLAGTGLQRIQDAAIEFIQNKLISHFKTFP